MTILAAAGPSAYWYLTRATGAVALVLLTLSVLLGILDSLRFSVAPRWPRFAIDALHRDVSLLVLVLLVAHIVTSVLDGFAPIKLLDAVIPFGSRYRPLWMGLGALSFDFLIALAVTSVLRRRFGYRAWRTIHWLAYASWPVAVAHGLGTGTDTKASWMLALTIACLAAVLIAVWVRIIRSGPQFDGLRVPALALSIATPLALAIFTVAGPLQRGWAKRAGTPANLLPKASFVSSGGQVTQQPGTRTLDHSFSAALAGTATQTRAPGGAIIELALRVSGSVHGMLRVRVGGTPLVDGGLSMTGSQVDLIADGVPSVMQGEIFSLQGEDFLARVADASGNQLDLHATLDIDNDSNRVTGTLSGTPASGGE